MPPIGRPMIMNTQNRGKSPRTVAAGPVRLTTARSTCSEMIGVRTSPTTETRKRPIMIPILLSIRFHAIKWGWGPHIKPSQINGIIAPI